MDGIKRTSVDPLRRAPAPEAPRVTPDVSRDVSPDVSPDVSREGASEAGEASKRVRAVVGDAPAPAHKGARNAGAVTAKTGLSLLDRLGARLGGALDGALRVSLKSVAVAGLVLASSAAWNISKADTVFFDHNDAPMEIAVAKRLAASLGEKFVLVRPDPASVEAVFARAERGELDLRHLIFSGHSTGQSVWGNGGDGTRHQTSMSQLKELKQKYPNAFAQVEHVHFMACYAGSAGNSAEWSAVFQNAKAIAGFWGSGPSKIQPAAHKMLESSEKHLRTLDNKTLTPQQAMIEAKRMANMPGSNVTKFAIRLDGVHYALGQKVEDNAVLADRVRLLELRAFAPWMNPVGQGAEFASTPTNHQASPLRDYYNALQAYRGALEPGSSDATRTNERVDQTIRLIYFDVMAQKMEEHHGPELAAARAELAPLGITLPDVTKATRLEIVTAANALDAMRAPQLKGFAAGNAADLALVGVAGTELGAIDETSLPWSIARLKTALAERAAQPDASADVKAAVERLTAQLDAPAPASLARAKELLGKGLRDLDPTIIPSTWIE